MRQKYQKFHNRPFESSLTSTVLIVLFCLRFSHCIDPQVTTVFEGPGLASTLLTSNNACNRLLPGLQKLRLGVDITQLDVLPLKATDKDGFKYPVIDFSCEEQRTRPIDDVSYDVPDHVIFINGKLEDISKSKFYIFKRSSDVLKVMGTNVGIDSITEGFFSASASYKRMASKIYNESRYVEYIVSYQWTGTAKFEPQYKLKLGRYAKIHVDKLLKNSFESDPEKYFSFIEYFGTHYFSILYFGGALQFYLETGKDYHQLVSDGALEAEARAIFTNFLKASGSYEGPLKKVDPYFTKNTNTFMRYYGGNTNIAAEDGISQWQSTLRKNPWIFGGQLKPISDLIDDKSKRKSMEKAIQIYIDKAYIDSLMDFLNWATIKYERFYKHIHEYKNEVKALTANDHNTVIKLGKKLGKQLEVPEWFLENYKLCFKWSQDGYGRQCGGGFGHYLCAKIGSMTPYYKDDTSERGNGCGMQWGIRKLGHVKTHWLKQIQICYRWWPDGDSGQCAGGTAGAACASVNNFTPKYIDNTDGRDGGCRMQWRLIGPDAAPIWYRSLKLCFEWYAMLDKDQCGGGVQRLECATNNSWTASYLDNTDSRTGYCRIRWGILLS